MQEMRGKFDHSDHTYEWWAGNASPGAEDEYCVHCRRNHVGVTRYTDKKLSQAEAEQIARDLAPAVERLG